MDRDRRLTGMLRGQTDNVEAPPGYELSSAWRVCCELANDVFRVHAYAESDGEEILLGRDGRGWSLAAHAHVSIMQPLLPMAISKLRDVGLFNLYCLSFNPSAQ